MKNGRCTLSVCRFFILDKRWDEMVPDISYTIDGSLKCAMRMLFLVYRTSNMPYLISNVPDII